MIDLYYAIQNDLVDTMSGLMESVDTVFEAENNPKIPEILFHQPTILSLATFLCSQKCFAYLINNKADLNRFDHSEQEMLPIHFAIASNNLSFFKVLVSKGSIVKGSLYFAVKFNNIQFFNYILSNNLENPQDIVYNTTALDYAKSLKRTEMVKALNELISKENSQNEEKEIVLKHENPLINAVLANDSKTVSKILEKDPSKINSTDDKGNTAFLLASQKNLVEMMKLLYEKGADVNILNKGGRSALHEACYKNRLEAVQYLVTLPTLDIKIKTANGRTALHCASKCGNPEIVKLLLHDLSPNFQDDDGDTPLHIAANNQHSDVIHLLLDVPGVKFNIRNKGGRAAFDLCSHKFLLPFRPKMNEIIENARERIKEKKEEKKKNRNQTQKQ
ncbi:hypothetical protein TVAG_126760 [Trichomonas vaginalis G3]|uniref:Uncharacterized protein n=1 Tax=Trichomonas vaginalis (strain ATCC PRA-98 / G3) TaxID=412133 RepID=A2FHT6_TRIV3|nr:spermatogenesis [Trichomonas vaginalis G3]EAX95546.1 hypothetical protein TVAG_126760 [Trichomonas vaginalis G3]KAI5514401.1 spermatogenesis [Trichomonas vaginalis G3]|eukprot:XP_001308476.1 hypothetical protein [Trichomonas vaginalis G3]